MGSKPTSSTKKKPTQLSGFLFTQELSLQLFKMKDSINIVWLKRDLRTTDHLPLYEAEKQQHNYIIIYLFEPNQINYVDYSLRHKQFIYYSIIEMNKLLKKYNREVIIYNENAGIDSRFFLPIMTWWPFVLVLKKFKIAF